MCLLVAFVPSEAQEIEPFVVAFADCVQVRTVIDNTIDFEHGEGVVVVTQIRQVAGESLVAAQINIVVVLFRDFVAEICARSDGAVHVTIEDFVLETESDMCPFSHWEIRHIEDYVGGLIRTSRRVIGIHYVHFEMHDALFTSTVGLSFDVYTRTIVNTD